MKASCELFQLCVLKTVPCSRSARHLRVASTLASEKGSLKFRRSLYVVKDMKTSEILNKPLGPLQIEFVKKMVDYGCPIENVVNIQFNTHIC